MGSYYDRDHHEHAEKGGNKSEARALLERRKTEVRLGVWQASAKANRGRWREFRDRAQREQPTLGEFASRWMEERATSLTPAVADDYRSLLRIHLPDNRLAQKPIDEVNDGDIMILVNQLRTTSGSKTVCWSGVDLNCRASSL